MIHGIVMDMHTHCIFSGHAYSTLEEMAAFVRTSPLQGFCLTDHSPYGRNACVDIYLPITFADMPREIDGVRVYYGQEVDLLDYHGTLAIPQPLEQLLEFGIFGMHENAIELGHDAKDCTDAICAVFARPAFDLLAHPCREAFPIDTETVVRAAKRYNKLIELNEHCLHRQKDGGRWYIEVLEACRKHEVRIMVNSDAHFSREIGNVKDGIALLRQLGFPESLVVNSSMEKIESYMCEREARFQGGRIATAKIPSSIFKMKGM